MTRSPETLQQIRTLIIARTMRYAKDCQLTARKSVGRVRDTIVDVLWETIRPPRTKDAYSPFSSITLIANIHSEYCTTPRNPLATSLPSTPRNPAAKSCQALPWEWTSPWAGRSTIRVGSTQSFSPSRWPRLPLWQRRPGRQLIPVTRSQIACQATHLVAHVER